LAWGVSAFPARYVQYWYFPRFPTRSPCRPCRGPLQRLIFYSIITPKASGTSQTLQDRLAGLSESILIRKLGHGTGDSHGSDEPASPAEEVCNCVCQLPRSQGQVQCCLPRYSLLELSARSSAMRGVRAEKFTVSPTRCLTSDEGLECLFLQDPRHDDQSGPDHQMNEVSQLIF
jgi:hypothetical protein